MRIILITVLTLFVSISIQAQKRFDLFYLAGNYNFMESSANEVNKNYETAIMSNLSIPIVLKDSSVWYTSIDYQYFSVDNEFSATSPVEKFNLHGFIFRTGYIHRFNSKKSIQVLFVPRVMTDFNTSFSKSLQFGGIIMYEKVKSKDLTWRAGVMFNQELFGTYIVPVFYLDWNITEKVKVKGLLPIYAKVYMQASENFSAGFHFIGLTTSYRIFEPNLENYYVDRRSIDVSLFTNVKVWDNIFLETRVGYSLSRDYGLYAEGDKMDMGLPLVNIGDNRVRLNEESGGSPFIHLRLIYSLSLN